MLRRDDNRRRGRFTISRAKSPARSNEECARWGEIARLDWSDIKETEIVTRAAKAKTRSRRIVGLPRT
jgi:integrase